MSKAVRMPAEKEPGQKVFSPANNNLQKLEDYNGVLSDKYWEEWVTNSYREEKGSFIDHNELSKVAKEMNYSEMRKVEEIAVMLEHGADIGVEGEGRWPSEEDNNESVYIYGERVADAL